MKQQKKQQNFQSGSPSCFPKTSALKAVYVLIDWKKTKLGMEPGHFIKKITTTSPAPGRAPDLAHMDNGQ